MEKQNEKVPLEIIMKSVRQVKRPNYTKEEMKARAQAIMDRIVNDDSPNGIAIRELARDLGKL